MHLQDKRKEKGTGANTFGLIGFLRVILNFEWIHLQQQATRLEAEQQDKNIKLEMAAIRRGDKQRIVKPNTQKL